MLPELRDHTRQSITIRPHVVVNIEPFSEAQKEIASEKQEDKKIIVYAKLTSPHPLIDNTLKSLKSAKPDERGLIKSSGGLTLNISVTKASIERALTIMDALIKALERRSLHVSCPGGRTIVDVHGEPLELMLTEKIKRQELEKTRESWRYGQPLYRYIPTGRLSLQITTEGRDGIRRSWMDGNQQRVGNCLNAFVVSLLRISEYIKEERRKDEEKRRQQEEWERQRAENIQLIQEEEKKIKELFDDVDGWYQSKKIRNFVQAARDVAVAKHGEIKKDSEVAEWIAWAKQQADRVDPLVDSPPSILDEKSQWEHSNRYYY